jgi:hypothetical protein
MSGSSRRIACALAVAMAILVPAGVAWSCVAVVSLTTNTKTVQPGGTLSVTGREFASRVPVDIHLDSPTGPVLATFPDPQPNVMTSKFTIDVQVPANITAGEHFLVATQNHHDMNSGQPARAVFYVSAAPPTTAIPVRPVGLVEDSGPSPAVLILITLGVAVVGLLIAGVIAASISRRGGGGPSPAAATTTPAGGDGR